MDQSDHGGCAARQPAQSNQHTLRKRKSKTVRIMRVGLCLCAVGFVIGGVIFGKALIDGRKADKVYAELRQQKQETAYVYSISQEALTVPVETPKPDEGEPEQTYSAATMNFAPLKEINSEIMAWLICEGTVIDYPVLRAEDNDYYLSHLYTKERNRMGSIFIDCRNTGLFTDKNTVMYGHNMKSGAMFNTLAEYKQQDYYDMMPTMKLYTPDGDYVIELFAGTVEDGNYEFVQFEFSSDEAFMEYVNGIRSRSTFQSDVVVEPTDQIVTLCTCSYERNNARYMVLGRLVRL